MFLADCCGNGVIDCRGAEPFGLKCVQSTAHVLTGPNRLQRHSSPHAIWRTQAVHPATYLRRRGLLAMLTRFWQTVQLLAMVSGPNMVHPASQPARGVAALHLWAWPNVAAAAVFAAACKLCTSSHSRMMLLLALPFALIARIAGVCSTLVHPCQRGANELKCKAVAMSALIPGGRAS